LKTRRGLGAKRRIIQFVSVGVLGPIEDAQDLGVTDPKIAARESERHSTNVTIGGKKTLSTTKEEKNKRKIPDLIGT